MKSIKIKCIMLCPLKKSELSNKNLFDVLEKELPLDVLYHIYTYCDVEQKRKIRQHYLEKNPIMMLTICLTMCVMMYFLGYLLTRRFLGVFIILNFLAGYLVCSALSLMLIIICIPFRVCEKVEH